MSKCQNNSCFITKPTLPATRWFALIGYWTQILMEVHNIDNHMRNHFLFSWGFRLLHTSRTLHKQMLVSFCRNRWRTHWWRFQTSHRLGKFVSSRKGELNRWPGNPFWLQISQESWNHQVVLNISTLVFPRYSDTPDSIWRVCLTKCWWD